MRNCFCHYIHILLAFIDTQARLRCSQVEVIATDIILLLSSLRTGWPLQDIYFSNGNESFHCYVDLYPLAPTKNLPEISHDCSVCASFITLLLREIKRYNLMILLCLIFLLKGKTWRCLLRYKRGNKGCDYVGIKLAFHMQCYWS